MKRAALLLFVIVAAVVLFVPTPFTGYTGLLARWPAGPPGSAGGPAVLPPTPTSPRHVLLITIDTLRADRIGVAGWKNARTPALDALARRGVRFTHAYATAPITLPSHASLLSGRYPPGHASRHNGVAAAGDLPTLTTALKQAGFATAAFVSAFPLDARFGLARGFDVYDDELTRGADGRPQNERAGAITVDRAIAWLRQRSADRIFMWVHLFEPHAPYGTPPAGSEPPRDVRERYDDEVATADREIRRLLDAWRARPDTLVVATSDHGEAFGEHGEIGHSIFVYDTTLHVPLMFAGAGVVRQGATVAEPVALVDVAPTILRLMGLASIDADGIDLRPALGGEPVPSRPLYAESFAPLLDFGWAPLRTIRHRGMKFIAAPRRELYDIAADAGEKRNLVETQPDVARDLAARVDRIAGPTLSTRATAATDIEAAARLRSLGYAGMGGGASADRPDPKDRIGIASRMAAVTSGELRGEAMERALAEVLKDDPKNPQAHLRLGQAMAESRRCTTAERHFDSAIGSGLPSADPYLGLAFCQQQRGASAAALATLRAGRQREPGNPVVDANIGLLELESGRAAAAVIALSAAVATDPDLHQARFALARALARLGRRADAERQATELLERLPADAPQRGEVQRLITALR